MQENRVLFGVATMTTITIELEDPVYAELKESAHATGQIPEQLIVAWIQERQASTQPVSRGKSLFDMPVHHCG